MGFCLPARPPACPPARPPACLPVCPPKPQSSPGGAIAVRQTTAGCGAVAVRQTTAGRGTESAGFAGQRPAQEV
ncbi:MAG: hypothetical protein QM296_02280 [Bacillota bacterium]|nr:hypothetical protein [Bacillota bacterium]